MCGNKGGNLCVTAIKDFICAFVEVVGYPWFNHSGKGGRGPLLAKPKLCLAECIAHRSGHLPCFTKAIMDFRGVEKLRTSDAHFESWFSSNKHKAKVWIGTNDETHRLNIVSYSQPQIMRRVIWACASQYYLSDKVERDLVEPSTSAGPSFQQVTTAQETKVNEWSWHIAHLRKTSFKACWKTIARNKKEYESHIV